jgi:iron complex outermembrane receptor protein
MRKTGLIIAAAATASLVAGGAFAAYMPNIGAPVIGAKSYAQDLLNRVVAAHHNVGMLTIYITLPGAKASESVASTTGRVGLPLPPTAVQAVRSGQAQFSYRAGELRAAVPMLDVSNHRAGVMTLTLKGMSEASLKREAFAIRTYLKRNTSFATNLVQKALWDTNLPLDSYAQQLVDEELHKHPNVLIMAIHAATPKNAIPEILGSNIGRIGKKDDSDDARVVNLGQTNLENNTELQRYEVELPLNDRAGKRIGALGVVFPFTKGMNERTLHEEAIRIRNELAGKIPSAAKLVEVAN